jgi:hypothetical protein
MADQPVTASVARTASVGAALAGLAAWLTLRNLRLPTSDGLIFWVPITLWLLTMSALCLWSALSGDQAASRASIRASWHMGWVVGAVGFAIGFVGPLVIWPKSNLGPLLGILLTGPVGFVVGVLWAGVVRAAHRSRPPVITSGSG